MVNEKRLIDANALRTQFDDIPPFIGVTGGCVQQYIDKAPTVDAVEVVHGRWEHSESMVLYYKCSKCKGWVTKHSVNEPDFNYCPNCGTKMDGDGNG